MPGIWTNTGDGWEVGKPQRFQDEATLHRLIHQNPHILPLAGSPRLVVLGSEVQLGNGYADILAVEPSGRPAIIEVKLASNSEARRAIVAQVIAYAAFLRGLSIEGLEQGPLSRHLANAGYESILNAVKVQDQDGAVNADAFTAALQGYLNQGNFRLVLALDDISEELERIVAYLDAITVQALTVDLITLQVYEVNGAQVALPQRVSLDPVAPSPAVPVGSITAKPAPPKPVRTDGSFAFRASIENAPAEAREVFEELIAWAEKVGDIPNVRLFTTSGATQTTLKPAIKPDDVGLVTIYNSNLRPFCGFTKTVFDRLAPESIDAVERAISPDKIGKGNWTPNITPELLEALTAAYQEAAGV